MSDTIKNQAVKGIAWSAAERFSVQGVTFLVQLVLARLLSPADYGIIGLLVVFIQVAQVFIDSGFANALIQKQKCTTEDYCTVFYYNVLISLAIYVIFFFTAPFVASFYHDELLTKVMRVVSIVIIINSLSIVQKTQLVKNVDFRSQTIVSLLSVIISGTCGIIMAYHDYGVWALCAQQILNSICMLIGYCICVRWIPRLIFSRASFDSLFKFGSRLLIASLISTIYKNLYTLVIGKAYNTAELGNYSRAEQFAMFPSNNLGNIIARVALPVFSKIQDDTPQLCSAYRRIIQYSSYLIFPLMCGLIAIAKPLILVLLTEKWIGVVPLLQILCFDWMLDHLSVLNLNLLYVKGRSDWALRLEIIKKSIAVIILIATIPFGLTVMCWGRVLYSVIATVINTHYTRILINLNFFQQMMDILPFLLGALVMGITVYCINMFIVSTMLQLLVGIFVGIVCYALITLVAYAEIRTRIFTFLRNLRKE